MKHHYLSLDFSQTDDGKQLSLLNIAEIYLMLGNNEKFFSYLNEIKDNLCDEDKKGIYYRVMGKYYLKNVSFMFLL